MPVRHQGNPDDLHVVVTLAGKTFDIVPAEKSLSWTTLALGGFGSCSFNLGGWWTREKLPYLANVKVYWGDLPLWEGRVEDLRYSLSADGIETVVQCFGYQRLLDDVAVVRGWLKRDIPWREIGGGDGFSMGTGGIIKTTNLAKSVGQYNPSDLTKSGIQVTGKGASVPANGFDGYEFFAGNAAVFHSYAATLVVSGANTGISKMGFLELGSNNTTPGGGTFYGTSQQVYDIVVSSPSNDPGNRIRMGMMNNSGGTLTPTSTDIVQLYNIAIIAARTATGVNFERTDDGGVTGAYFGGTILRDLITLVPGLAAGIIEDGSDFSMTSITSDVRRAARNVLNEVIGYYSREWGVWEDSRLDWKTPNLEEPQWILDIADLSGLQLDTTLDDLAVTEYVLYTDAVTDGPLEASAASTDQRNPFAKAGQRKDMLNSPSFAMTANTSAQLAARLAATRGQYPTVAGSISLPMMAMVDRVGGQQRPAAAIRAGENVLIPQLPKSDPFTQGRDGQTLFHIVSTSATAEDGTITLEVEGFTKTQDALMARLAAVTRNLTG